MKIFVTGGAGFIGSALIKELISNSDNEIINIDKLTYAGNLLNLKDIENKKKYKFKKFDINDFREISELFSIEKPDAIINLAAESHVDRSITEPANFIKTNILGTFSLLEVVREYIIKNKNKKRFKFLHVSTDEVFGDLSINEPACNEDKKYAPSSPYSASKASSDHLVRAWGRTYNIQTIITNCTNNYGPFQFPEKLIPVTINNIISEEKIPIYGDGNQCRDWLYVDDHARALSKILIHGKVDETYNISGNNNISNINLVKKICQLMDKKQKKGDLSSSIKLISFVKDREGHDVRYALDSSKVRNELNWQPIETIETGLEKTIDWYLQNQEWTKEIIK